MSLAAVHQFHSGTAIGDAVTNQMLDLQRRLRAAGFLSEIYAQHIASGLEERIRPLDQLRSERSTMLLVHHSMGHTAFEQLMAIELPMVTIFHSITPAHFFEDEELRRFVRLGFRQLRSLAIRSEFGIADSNHNRKQMYDAGFSRVDVLPVRTDFSEMHAIRSMRTGHGHDWLFVGRVVPNKHQFELVRAFATHRAAFSGGHLHLVGDLSLRSYVESVRSEISRLGIDDAVTLHGKVDQDALLAHYRDAGLFVCLSEHEGFGVPLLEAMAAGIPVIARRAAAIAETMGGAGVLLDEAEPSLVAAAAHVVGSDEALRERLVAHQLRRLSLIEGIDVDACLHSTVEQVARGLKRRSLQIQGPFETSYSLAILNRELALGLAMTDQFDVSIYATEGPGDYTPAPSDLEAHPAAAQLYEKAAACPYPEVAIRQMFPPRVDDSPAGMTFQYFGWEESLLPAEVAADFDAYLDGIGVMSTYVGETLRRSGVSTPISVVGVGVHPPAGDAVLDDVELAELRSRVLLHISSAFPRKGVDALLRAYFEEFTDADDVSLVLKTFPNPHNDVEQLLAELRGQFDTPPHVCWIDRDMTRDQLDALYRLASGYVHAARGEGFGLPVAEAMLARVPVISVDSSGLADFVSGDTAAVVGHHLAPATSHVSIVGSTWSEPSIGDLRREMRALVDGTDSATRLARLDAAEELIRTRYSWAAVTDRWAQFVQERVRRRTPLKVAAVTTFNSRCGIAEYSAHLYGAFGEALDLEVHADIGATPIDPVVEESVLRAWHNHRRGQIHDLIEALDGSTAPIVHIQHNVGFFTTAEFERLIDHEVSRRPTVITLHRTTPLDVDGKVEALTDIADTLQRVDAIIVHQESDRLRLAAAGIEANVRLMLHGTNTPIATDQRSARRRHGLPPRSFIIGTFGFLLPHKGVLRLLRAVAILRDRGIDAWFLGTCALHPDPSSAAHELEVRSEIKELGIERATKLITDFLAPEVSLDILSAADLLVLAYDPTAESASGALRSVLPLGKPIVTSRLPIFEDVAGVVEQIDVPADPAALADLLEGLWRDEQRRELLATRVQEFAERTSWRRTAQATRELYWDVLSARGA